MAESRRVLLLHRESCRKYVATCRAIVVSTRREIAARRDRYNIDSYDAALDILDTVFRRLEYAQDLLVKAEQALADHLVKEAS